MSGIGAAPAGLAEAGSVQGAPPVGDLHRGIACGLLAAVIWGAYLAVSGHGIAQGLDATDLAFLRYAAAGPLLLPWLLRHAPMSLAHVGWPRGLVLVLVAGPLFLLAGASGYHYAPLAHGAVLQLGAMTLTSAVLAKLLVNEALTARRIVGLLILVVGLAVISGPSLLQSGSGAWRGDLLFALAGVMWALFAVLQRRWSVPPMAATAIVCVLSAILFVPGYLLVRGLSVLAQAPLLVIAEQVIVLGILSGIVALFAFGKAIQLLGAGRAAVFPALAPAVAIALGMPLLGQYPDTPQLIGLGLLSIGLVAVLSDNVPGPHPIPAGGGR